MQNVYIFHENGTKGHYRALIDREQHIGDVKLVFREFSILKKIIKALIKRDSKTFFKQFVNMWFLLKLLFLKDKTIIVGIAPYDFRLLWYYPLLKKNKYFYHTSKTTWGYVNYSKRFLAQTSASKKVWNQFITNATGVFCATQVVEEQLQTYYNPKQTCVVNHAINRLYATALVTKPEISKIRCLFVGRLEKSKGVLLIIELIQRLSSEHFEFVFIGKGSLEETIKLQEQEHDNVYFLGFKKDPELKTEYDKADVFLAPSIKTGPWEELFGMVIIEAMSRGVIPITTDHSGPKGIITSAENGFYFREADYTLKAEAELRKLQENHFYLAKLRAKAFAEGQEYSPQAIYKRWNALLKVSKL